MTLEKAFEHLLENWIKQEPGFKEKYKPYRSKHEKSKKMKPSEIMEKDYYVGDKKKREMLLNAGYKMKPEAWTIGKK